MSNFDQDKADKLSRMWFLRLLNALGVMAWCEDRYGCAEHQFRRLHPLTWLVVLGFIVIGSLMYGVPETIRTLRDSPDHFTWW